MSYRILLNKTRKEAFLLSEDSNEEEEYEMKNLSHFLKQIAKLNWCMDDEILLYETNRICYYNLEGYKELNFITYNREAHLT